MDRRYLLQNRKFFWQVQKTKYFYSLDGHYDEKLLLRKMRNSKRLNNINFASKTYDSKSLVTIDGLAQSDNFTVLYKDFKL